MLFMGVFLSVPFFSDAQKQSFEGHIFDYRNRSLPLPGVHITKTNSEWLAQTTEDGGFRFELDSTDDRIVLQYAGYSTDTIDRPSRNSDIIIYLKPEKKLDGVVVTSRRKTTEIGLLDPMKTERIGHGELMKAACCNLSESFETTPSIDVSYSDAVTGYRQIQMLGLSGPNLLITRENIPDVRGLAAITGLTFTPGTWIEGMQLSKGTGSVVNGQESVAGQVNVEWHKPMTADRWKFNLYQNTQGLSEANIVASQKINETFSTNLFAYGRSNWRRNDQNNDGFMDQPLGKNIVLANRWFGFLPNRIELQLGVKGTYSDATGGQSNYEKGSENSPLKPWGFESNIKRMEAWAKVGTISKMKPWRSIGLQMSGSYYNQNALYGLTHYDANEKYVYANLIYQTIVDNTNHVIKTGASFSFSDINENIKGGQYLQPLTLKRTEAISGAFAEYAYSYLTKFNIVAGLRGDYNSYFEQFNLTPRLHIRYAPWERSSLRASVGRAQRTANLFSENLGYLASNRVFIFSNSNHGNYPFRPEVAWNYGINFTQKFKLNFREGVISADFYRTDFENQIVVDIENPDEVNLYNLNGASLANSFQIQLDYEPIHKFDVRLAYRWYDVNTQFNSGYLQKAFVANHRAFANLGYETRRDWKFDYTIQWIGSKRVPVTYHHGNHLEPGFRSPSYVQMNAQITKSFTKFFDVYVGGENLTNYMQHGMILGADNPYGQGFDASMIWGPAMGRNIYVGLRYNIK